MSSPEKIKIVQAGASGLVAEQFQTIIGHSQFSHIPLEIEAVAASRETHIGKKLVDVLRDCPTSLEDVPFISMKDAVNNTDAPVVFSALRNGAAEEHEDDLAKGRLVVTNAGANRMRSDVALLNPYINDQIDELYAQDRPGYIAAVGNCGSVILGVGLAPFKEYIDKVTIETMQGWSGKGIGCVPGNHEAAIVPIEGDEKEKLETEPQKLLGAMAMHADIDIVATPQRGPWVLGHHLKAEIDLVQKIEPITQEMIESLWEQFRAPDWVAEEDYTSLMLPQSRPIHVLNDSLTYPTRKGLKLLTVDPMQINAHVQEVTVGLPDRATIEISGNNLVLGAAGSGIMNILHAIKKGYIK